MMHTLTYTSNRAGTVIDLADPEGIMCGQILELRTRTWEFELGYRSLRATRPAKTVKVTGLVYGIPALEKAEELFDADMYAYLNDAAKPGVITVDGWSQTCLVVGHEPDYTSPLLVRGDFTVALLDGGGTNRSGRASAGRWPATTEARTIPTTIATITRRPATSAASTTNPPCPRG